MAFRRFSTVDPKETTRFSTYKWWNPKNALHPFTDVRVSYLKKMLNLKEVKPFENMRILDIGCGGGLISERLGRLGGRVLGIDPTPEAIEVAKAHLPPYLRSRVEYENIELSQVNGTFDLVIASEVIEHVLNPGQFLKDISERAESNVFISTVNRTPEAYWVGIWAAENVLGIVEPGTHDFSKFLTPEELKNYCQEANLEVVDLKGWFLDYLRFKAFEVDTLRIGYMAHCTKLLN